jgi:hypothetical protein
MCVIARDFESSLAKALRSPSDSGMSWSLEAALARAGRTGDELDLDP